MTKVNDFFSAMSIAKTILDGSITDIRIYEDKIYLYVNENGTPDSISPDILNMYGWKFDTLLNSWSYYDINKIY